MGRIQVKRTCQQMPISYWFSLQVSSVQFQFAYWNKGLHKADPHRHSYWMVSKQVFQHLTWLYLTPQDFAWQGTCKVKQSHLTHVEKAFVQIYKFIPSCPRKKLLFRFGCVKRYKFWLLSTAITLKLSLIINLNISFILHLVLLLLWKWI